MRKETQEYHHFEIYPLGKTLTKEYVIKTVENFNTNETKDLIAKIYDDPVLTSFVEDVRSSYRNKEFITNLRSICEDIQHSVNELEDLCENIEDLLKKSDEQKRVTEE